MNHHDPTVLNLSATRVTNTAGRCLDLLPPVGSDEAKKERTDLVQGKTYKIVFKTKEYFESTGRISFYPWVEVSQPH
jgi:5-hydroxyisourate hydrolase